MCVDLHKIIKVFDSCSFVLIVAIHRMDIDSISCRSLNMILTIDSLLVIDEVIEVCLNQAMASNNVDYLNVFDSDSGNADGGDGLISFSHLYIRTQPPRVSMCHA